jgi:hypothetical protein
MEKKEKVRPAWMARRGRDVRVCVCAGDYMGIIYIKLGILHRAFELCMYVCIY